MPDLVPGYRPSGGGQTAGVRVFEGGLNPGGTVIDEFPSAISHCADSFWTLRWRTLNPNVTVSGFRVGGGFNSVDAEQQHILVSSRSDGPIPAPTHAGYISGFFCQQPAFKFGASTDTSNLVDVTVEWQQWNPAP